MGCLTRLRPKQRRRGGQPILPEKGLRTSFLQLRSQLCDDPGIFCGDVLRFSRLALVIIQLDMVRVEDHPIAIRPDCRGVSPIVGNRGSSFPGSFNEGLE